MLQIKLEERTIRDSDEEKVQPVSVDEVMQLRNMFDAQKASMTTVGEKVSPLIS